jgi:hypothetical protein
MPLSKDDILAADDLTRELVHVPEWGGDVWVGTMTGRERDAFEADFSLRDDPAQRRDFRARLLVHCLVDNEGERLFSPADVEALTAKSAAALTRVFDVATRLNRLTEKDVAELEGNFESGQADDSGSVSA